MSSGINKVILVGNLGDDPDMRYTQNDTAVCNISVACSESWKDREGQKQERTEWVRVVAFGKLAEIMGEYLHKGGKVYIEGKMRTESYEKDGETKYTTKVYADEMRMLSGPRDGGGGERRESAPREQSSRQPARQQSSRQSPASNNTRRAPPQRQAPPPDEGFTDDMIPF